MSIKPSSSVDLSEVTRGAPSYALASKALADTELLLTGAFAPLRGFLGSADAAAVRSGRTLADGTAWPVPVTLDVPAEVADGVEVGGSLVLEDPEGTPVAQLQVEERWTDQAVTRLAGPVQPLRPPAEGVFRRLHRSPEDVRADLPAGEVYAVLVDRPLHHDTIAAAKLAAGTGHLLLLVPTAGGRDLPADSLVRLALAAAAELPAATVVAVRLAGRSDADDDLLLTTAVAARYGATGVLHDRANADHLTAPAAVPLTALPAVEYDARNGYWLPAADVATDNRLARPSATEVERLLAAGDPLPSWFSPAAVAAELRHARPPLQQRGCTVFLTGLSGAGKSTIARALHDALAERADRSVTLLDGDIVRRMLSAGLGFSRVDRDRNVLRIGYVAAEVGRHGGLAICAPIAPYQSTRAEVRRMVTESGNGFVLVHVATSLEVCESRDRKGLYAKARAGEIQEFTGVSDPYETPTDAELTLDTGELAVEESVQRILDYLTENGWLQDTGKGTAPQP